MRDLIDKLSVCEILADIYPTDGEKVVGVERIDKAYEAVLTLPSAQPERKKGKWLTNLYEFGEDRYECDQCHNTALHRYDFCPNCGADMRGEQDE